MITVVFAAAFGFRNYCSCLSDCFALRYIFVRRKDHKLRWIFDPRTANSKCLPPPRTVLPSPSALSQLEVGDVGPVFLCTGDVEVAFYQYSIPTWLQQHFVLPEIRLKFLPVAVQRRLGHLSSNGRLNFAVRVLPMGWSWSVYLMQMAHRRMLNPLADMPWVGDKRATPAFGVSDDLPLDAKRGVRMLYIDNFGVLSVDQKHTEGERDRMIERLGQHGVPSAPDAEDHNELIGFSLDGELARWRPTWKKLSRFVAAGRWLCRPGLLTSGREVEVFLGHAIHVLGIRSELMCIPYAIYSFVRRHYWHRARLWPSVLKEVRWMVALVPLAFADMCRSWSPTIHAYDASLKGFGVVCARADTHVIGSVGRTRTWTRSSNTMSPTRPI